jgi:hypothetical protein
MKIFKELKKLGYKHYTEHTVEELDNLPLESKERIMEQALVLSWFREKQEIEGFVHKSIEGNYYFVIKRTGNNESNMYEFTKTAPKTFDTYEEAELACLEKLIEICSKLK